MNIWKGAKRYEKIYVSLREMEEEKKTILEGKKQGKDHASLHYATVYIICELMKVKKKLTRISISGLAKVDPETLGLK